VENPEGVTFTEINSRLPPLRGFISQPTGFFYNNSTLSGFKSLPFKNVAIFQGIGY